MFTIRIGEREFTIGKHKPIISAINDGLSAIGKVNVVFQEADPNVYVGGVSRLTLGQIESKIKPNHKTEVVDHLNGRGVSDRSTIVYTAVNN